MVRTTPELEVLDGIIVLVGPQPTHAELESLDPEVRKTLVASGLIGDLLGLDDISEIEAADFELSWWIAERFGRNAQLVGSSSNSTWIELHLPMVSRLCRSDITDVRSLDRFMRAWIPGVQDEARQFWLPRFTNRVYEDILDAINTARFYRAVILGMEPDNQPEEE